MPRKIIEFYFGRECPYCVNIIPAVKRLVAEDEVEIKKCEVWHNTENSQRMGSLRELYGEYCGGNFTVPSFYDPETKRLVCNPGSYENLKKWVFAEEVKGRDL